MLGAHSFPAFRSPRWRPGGSLPRSEMQIFPTTRWSVLAQATLNGETDAGIALAEFYRRYQGPIQRALRWRGVPDADVEDLTHDFLLHLLRASSLRRADRERGRFRNFLLGALLHFLADAQDRRMAQKRGAGAAHVSLDQPESDSGEPSAPVVAAPPALVQEFDRSWAIAILNDSLTRLEAEFIRDGNAEQFAVFRRFLPGASEPMPYEAAAERLGRPLATIKSDILRLRRRLRELVRGTIAETVSAPHEIDAEMRHLQAVLLDRGSELGGGSVRSNAT